MISDHFKQFTGQIWPVVRVCYLLVKATLWVCTLGMFFHMNRADMDLINEMQEVADRRKHERMARRAAREARRHG